MQEKIVRIIRLFVGFFLVTIMGVVGLFLRVVSFGALTNFNRRYFVPVFSKFILFAIGIRVDNRVKLPAFDRPHFITFNHASHLDAFVLMTLGLTDTRFLMTENMIRFIPVTLAALSIGVLFIPSQDDPERRLEFFKRLAERIESEKVSIAGSSEGACAAYNTINPFNRGVYHMALVSGMPVVAIFIYTPVESNPFNDFRPIRSGTIRMELIDIIPTSDWRLEDLDHHIETVRERFVEKFNSSVDKKVA